MKRFVFIMATIVALAIAGYVWVDTQWFGGWGTPGWVEDARTEILATPLFNDPPPEWTERYRSASTALGGKREHITASWTAPGTVAEAVKALHDRHGDLYSIRRANAPGSQTVLERWVRRGSQLSILVSYRTTTTPNKVGVSADIDAPRELLRNS